MVKPVKLTLTPHHLFYLLSKFEEIGIAVGAMNIRLENIHQETAPGNYVSFLSSAQRKKARGSDRDSLHSVSSVRSVLSGMSAIWSNLGLSPDSTAKSEKARLQLKEDLRYLYSAFTKIPCLKLSPDHKAHLIAGYEEFPFDSAVPLFVFKNLSALEICDIDFRHFYGWDRLSEQLRSLTIKRGVIDDPADLIINIVLDDIDRRRRRSSKSMPSPIMPLPTSSSTRDIINVSSESVQSMSSSLGKPDMMLDSAHSLGSGPIMSPSVKVLNHKRNRSVSPQRPSSSRRGSLRGYGRSNTPTLRRSSGSSSSSMRTSTPRGSSSNLLAYGTLPPSKWRFLKHLSLTDNSLTCLSAFGFIPIAHTLQSLDLSANLFTEIPESLGTLSSLRALNLSNCMIESLHSLMRNPLPAITALNLRGNRLSSLAGAEGLLSLERLDLRENRLKDPMELARLTGAPGIHELFVHRNPFTKSHRTYRITIFNIFRTNPAQTADVIIDGSLPLHSEKKHLADRIPAPGKAPVLHPVSGEPNGLVMSRTSKVIDRSQSVRASEEQDDDADSIKTLKSNSRAQSQQRRKKTTKRRIVDLLLAENKSPSTLGEVDIKHAVTESKAVTTNQTSTTDQGHTAQCADYATESAKAKLPPTIDQRLAQASINDGSEGSTTSRAKASDEGDVYRKRLEALRNDFGDSWLSALSDNSWDNQRLPGHFPGQDPIITQPVVANVSARSPAQSIVSVGNSAG